MFGRTRAILNRGCGHRYCNGKKVACFSALSAKHKGGGTTPGELSKKSDPAAEGSEDGYGGSGISNVAGDHYKAAAAAAEDHLRGRGRGGFEDLNRGSKSGERWREEKDMEDAAASVAEMAKTGVVGAMETGLKMGEMAKRTIDGVWDATRKTTESVRDSVADDDDDSGGYRRKPGSDKHVEDLRSQAGGYDVKD